MANFIYISNEQRGKDKIRQSAQAKKLFTIDLIWPPFLVFLASNKLNFCPYAKRNVKNQKVSIVFGPKWYLIWCLFWKVLAAFKTIWYNLLDKRNKISKGLMLTFVQCTSIMWIYLFLYYIFLYLGVRVSSPSPHEVLNIDWSKWFLFGVYFWHIFSLSLNPPRAQVLLSWKRLYVQQLSIQCLKVQRRSILVFFLPFFTLS